MAEPFEPRQRKLLILGAPRPRPRPAPLAPPVWGVQRVRRLLNLAPIVVILLSACTGLRAQAPELVMHNGFPALKSVEKDKGEHPQEYVAYVDRTGTPGHHVLPFRLSYLAPGSHLGLTEDLSVSRTMVSRGPPLRSAIVPEPPYFSLPRTKISDVQTICKRYCQLILNVSRIECDFTGNFLSSSNAGLASDGSREYFQFLETALRDFAAADAEFSGIRGEKPDTSTGLMDDDFRAKAAAWRALPEKPGMSEEAHRQLVLAHAALQEKG